jgi:hypothetical protein
MAWAVAEAGVVEAAAAVVAVVAGGAKHFNHPGQRRGPPGLTVSLQPENENHF